jgi:uncharacterized protein
MQEIYLKKKLSLWSIFTKRISLLSVSFDGPKLAKIGFADRKKSTVRKEQIKYFFRFLISPKFANEWLTNLKMQQYSEVLANQKLLFIKPFREYVSIKWTKKQKAKVVLDTYRFILSKGSTFMNVLTENKGLKIASFDLNETMQGHLYLSCGWIHNREGELLLSFLCDEIDEIITSAVISFEEIEENKWVCRIGCVQGNKKNDQNVVKIMQKLLHGFRPKAFIISIVQEFSRQLGCEAVFGVSDAIHVYREIRLIYLKSRHGIQFDYDALWIESGGELVENGWFQLPLVPVRKKYEEIQSHKRAYYRRRFALCDDISARIAATIKNE